ncbi:MAG: TVP38/TMEM64 family protein [Bacilli bacterium]|nr:TVP38/TMEM64 family protein [Bacilli bacterium]
MRQKNVKRIFNIITFIITIIIISLIAIGLKKGLFSSPDKIVVHVKKYGIFAPIIFTLLQITQVVMPIIPGGVSSLAGVTLFGSIKGFILNYIGLSLGSLCAFLLAKRFGLKLISMLFSKKTINKYIKYINNEKFEKFFFITIALPFFPDDLLCYIAGLSKISIKKFLTIILIGRPISLIAYSIVIQIFPRLFS